MSFQYPNRSTYALKNINLVIKAGESIGFVGISGSGKTTLLDVLLGLIKPSSGSIKFNEVPLEESLPEWLSNTAYIPQMVFLMDDSLKKNIALGMDDEQVDINRLHQAIEQAQLSDLVEQLPKVWITSSDREVFVFLEDSVNGSPWPEHFITDGMCW